MKASRASREHRPIDCERWNSGLIVLIRAIHPSSKGLSGAVRRGVEAPAGELPRVPRRTVETTDAPTLAPPAGRGNGSAHRVLRDALAVAYLDDRGIDRVPLAAQLEYTRAEPQAAESGQRVERCQRAAGLQPGQDFGGLAHDFTP